MLTSLSDSCAGALNQFTFESIIVSRLSTFLVFALSVFAKTVVQIWVVLQITFSRLLYFCM